MNNSKSLVARLDAVSLFLVVLCMCTQVDLHHVGHDTLKEGLGFATKTQAVSLPDIVFAATLLWFAVRTTQLQAWRKLWLPPLPCWALIVAISFSVLHSVTIHDALMTSFHKHGHGPHGFLINETKPALSVLTQWTGYFLAAPLLLVNLLWDRREGEPTSRTELAFKALWWALGLNIFAAAVQWALPNSATVDTFLPHHDLPTGLMGSPNMLMAYLGVVTPILCYWLMKRSGSTSKVFEGSAPQIAVFYGVSTSVVGVFLLGVELLTSRIRSHKQALPVGLLLVFPLLAVLMAIGPRAYSPIGSQVLQVSSATQKVKKQYVEWQAAVGWNMPRGRAFATGVGAGNYQLNIGPLYGGLPNEEKMPPDSNNLYLVQAVSIGILGLGTLLWTVGHFYGIAWSLARGHGNWLALGVIGSLTCWFVVNLFHAMIVRGPGLLLALFFAFAVVATYQTHSLAARNPDEPAAV